MVVARRRPSTQAMSATAAHSAAQFVERLVGLEEDRRRELYLRRHDRIDNWDLVDRAAPHVVGGYPADAPRDVLYALARSG